MKKIIRCIPLFILLLLPVNAQQGERIEYFSFAEDIKDDFCGINMDFKYCKCAFHNQYCNDVNMNKGQAKAYVNQMFMERRTNFMQEYAQMCMDKGSIWNRPASACITCQDGYVKDKGRCVSDDDYVSVKEKYQLPSLDWVTQPKEMVSKVRAKVSGCEGEAFVFSATFQKWKGPVSSGLPLFANDVLLTTSRGYCQLTVYSKTGADTVDVGTDTMFMIGDNSPMPEQSFLTHLYEGIIRIFHGTSNKAQPPIVFRTVTLSTGARGTDYLLMHDKDTKSSTVIVHDGQVDVSTDATGYILSEGDSLSYDAEVISQTTVSREDWESILQNSSLGLLTEEGAVGGNLSQLPIDPDSVYPSSIEYDGKLVDITEDPKKGLSFIWFILILVGLTAIYFGFKYHKKSGQ